jgi:hypothetical protein
MKPLSRKHGNGNSKLNIMNITEKEKTKKFGTELMKVLRLK